MAGRGRSIPARSGRTSLFERRSESVVAGTCDGKVNFWGESDVGTWRGSDVGKELKEEDLTADSADDADRKKEPTPTQELEVVLNLNDEKR
jgi:hypothetical protein